MPPPSASRPPATGRRRARSRAKVRPQGWQTPALIVTAWHPTDPAQAHVHELRAPASIESLAPRTLAPVVCLRNGKRLKRGRWGQAVKKGDRIVFGVRPQGGGKTGKILRTVALVAVIAAATFVTAGGAAPLFASVGITGTSAVFAGAAAGAAIGIAGQLLIGALTPKAGLGNLGAISGPAASPTYNAQLAGNAARLGQPVPVIYGRQQTYPDYAQPPYYDYDDQGNQYLNALYVVTQGFYKPERLCLGDTPLTNFDNIGYRFVQPGENWIQVDADGTGESVRVGPLSGSIRLHMFSAEEVAGQDLKDDNEAAGPFVACDADTGVNRLHFDVAAQVYSAQPDGSLAEYSVGWRWEYQRLVDGVPDGPWVVLANEAIAGASLNLVRRSYSYAIPPGQVQVRMVRTSPRPANSNIAATLSWQGLRAELAQPADVASRRALRADWTLLAVRIRVDGQISALSSRKLCVTGTRMIPVWENGAWTPPRPCRNPAWIATDILRNAAYGAGLPDDRIDLERFSTLAQTWRTRGDWFDGVFDSARTLFETLGLVLGVGRAVPNQRMGVVTAVRDEARTVPAMLFTGRNIEPGSLTVEAAPFTDTTPDVYVFTYQDSRVWKTRSFALDLDGRIVSLYDPQYLRARPFTRELFGITEFIHALREAQTFVASAVQRRQVVSWSCEGEALGLGLGDLVHVTHEMLTAGQVGEVEAYDPATRRLLLTEPLNDASRATDDLRVVLTDRLGRPLPPQGCAVATDDPESRTVVLADDLPAGFVPFTGGNAERTKYALGEGTSQVERVRVTAIRHQGGLKVSITGLVEADGVHAADAANLLPGSQAAYETGGDPIPASAETGDQSTIMPPSSNPPGDDTGEPQPGSDPDPRRPQKGVWV